MNLIFCFVLLFRVWTSVEIIVCTFSSVKNTKGSCFWGGGGEQIYILIYI